MSSTLMVQCTNDAVSVDIKENQNGTAWQFNFATEGLFTIGREKSNDIVIGDLRVGRKDHATVEVGATGITLRSERALKWNGEWEEEVIVSKQCTAADEIELWDGNNENDVVKMTFVRVGGAEGRINEESDTETENESDNESCNDSENDTSETGNVEDSSERDMFSDNDGDDLHAVEMVNDSNPLMGWRVVPVAGDYGVNHVKNRNYRGNDVMPVKISCDYCMEKYLTVSSCNRHMKKHFAEFAKQTQPKAPKKITFADGGWAMLYQCSLCPHRCTVNWTDHYDTHLAKDTPDKNTKEWACVRASGNVRRNTSNVRANYPRMVALRTFLESIAEGLHRRFLQELQRNDDIKNLNYVYDITVPESRTRDEYPKYYIIRKCNSMDFYIGRTVQTFMLRAGGHLTHDTVAGRWMAAGDTEMCHIGTLRISTTVPEWRTVSFRIECMLVQFLMGEVEGCRIFNKNGVAAWKKVFPEEAVYDRLFVMDREGRRAQSSPRRNTKWRNIDNVATQPPRTTSPEM